MSCVNSWTNPLSCRMIALPKTAMISLGRISRPASRPVPVVPSVSNTMLLVLYVELKTRCCWCCTWNRNLSPKIYEKRPKESRPAPSPYGASLLPRWELNVWLQRDWITITVHIACHFVTVFFFIFPFQFIFLCLSTQSFHTFSHTHKQKHKITHVCTVGLVHTKSRGKKQVQARLGSKGWTQPLSWRYRASTYSINITYV